VIGEDLGFLRERARLCRSCSDDPASCLTFPSVTPASLTFDGRYILALPADPAVQGYAAVGIATR
jgi:hypothetical protein